MNIIYIGSKGALSVDPLLFLLQQNVNIVAIAFDKPIVSINNLAILNVVDTTKNTVENIAYKHNIPTVNINAFNADRELELSYFKPTLFVVSCLSQLLPVSLLSLAVHGGINVHPSLLPKFRGVSPLFWQFKSGVDTFGVTLHKMNAFYDQGNIVNQQSIVLDNSISIDNANAELAKIASVLLLKTINEIDAGTLHETPQNKKQASEQTSPTTDDYQIETSWTTKRIVNFISAYEGKAKSFKCTVNKQTYLITKIISYQNNSVAQTNNTEVFVNGNALYFACEDGFIQAEIVV